MYQEIKNEFSELEKKLIDPKIINNQKKLITTTRRHSEIIEIINQ